MLWTNVRENVVFLNSLQSYNLTANALMLAAWVGCFEPMSEVFLNQCWQLLNSLLATFEVDLAHKDSHICTYSHKDSHISTHNSTLGVRYLDLAIGLATELGHWAWYLGHWAWPLSLPLLMWVEVEIGHGERGVAVEMSWDVVHCRKMDCTVGEWLYVLKQTVCTKASSEHLAVWCVW
mgnify:CR=1 FL=1